MNKFSVESYDAFFEAVLKLKTVDEARDFFDDVFTIKELDAISQRLEVASMLKEGKNYQEISRATGASTATISRVNKCLLYGRGGYNIVLGDQEAK